MAINHLKTESSPYLLQHADNPVDWWPWCDEALAQAKRQHKPVLLSIGYSACHWCHVMAHESFENESIAEVMNQLFINIKVDREERPDLDKIYQQAFQLINQRSGGWPLNVFLAPDDLTPFFAGTYFPDQARHGMPAFMDVLQQIENFYQQNKNDIQVNNQALRKAMEPVSTTETLELDSQPIDAVSKQLASHFDSTYGGFGAAPKFPHPSNLLRLLKHWEKTTSDLADSKAVQEDKVSRDMVNLTLHAMASGGMFDQLGGGFFRYSVDDKWMIPHFEKMLYDNGPLLSLYADAWQLYGSATFKRISEEIATWVIREMQSEKGGYYSTQDADSEGEEGRFYVWQSEEVKQLLSGDEYAVIAKKYGLDKEANFEGQWHFHVYFNNADVAATLNLNESVVIELENSAKSKLLLQRNKRVHPDTDEKVLTAWNGLMITGMAKAGRLFGNEEFLLSAAKSIHFIQKSLYKNKRLLATYKNGNARLMAYLDDYAFLLQGILEYLQANWNQDCFLFAIELAESIIDCFEDTDAGGFYFTANDHETLFHRPKPVMDDAIPAGNAIAVLMLNRLGHMLGETRYINSSEKALKHFFEAMKQLPYAHCSLLDALEENLTPPRIVIIRDKLNNKINWFDITSTSFTNTLVYFIPAEEKALPGLLQNHVYQKGGVAYLCQGTTCFPPIKTVHELKFKLKN